MPTWTHYDKRTKTAYSVSACEVCGCAVRVPNSVRIPNVKEAENAGLFFAPAVPPEQVWDERRKLAVCKFCECAPIAPYGSARWRADHWNDEQEAV